MLPWASYISYPYTQLLPFSSVLSQGFLVSERTDVLVVRCIAETRYQFINLCKYTRRSV